MTTLEPLLWRDLAPCRSGNQDDWFPPTHATNQRPWFESARGVCKRCRFWEDCLEEGQHEKYGMWGGLTPRERTGKRQWPHSHWIRYRQGCRCPSCTAAHDDAC